MMAIGAGALAQSMPDAAAQTQFASVSRLMSVTTALTGPTFLALRATGLAQFAKFVTHSVVGGFLTATGILARGRETAVYELQGFLFFGTSNALYDRIASEVERAGVPVRNLVVDFRRVEGFDVSTSFVFKRLLRFATSRGIRPVFVAEEDSRIRSVTSAALERTGREHPDFGARFNAILATYPARRLGRTTALFVALDR